MITLATDMDSPKFCLFCPVDGGSFTGLFIAPQSAVIKKTDAIIQTC